MKQTGGGVDIFYKGVLPKLNYWTDIPLSEYNILENIFENKYWSYQEEAIKTVTKIALPFTKF